MKLQDNIKSNYLILLIILLLCMPSIGLLFLTNIIPLLFQIFLYFFVICVVVGAYITYFMTEKRKYFKLSVAIVILLAAFFFFHTFREQQHLGKWIYFKKNEADLNEFVREIKKHPQITSFYGNISYEQASKEISIDKNTYNEFKRRLNDVHAEYFLSAYATNSIAFVCDGSVFADSGVMYYEGQGWISEYIHHEKIAENWYLWSH